MQESTGRDSAGLLVEVTKHHEFLVAISDGPKSKRSLAEHLDVSEKTVYRKAKRLDEHKLVERTSDGYTLTGAGQICLDLWSNLRCTTDTVVEGADLLNSLDRESVPPSHVLRNATVIKSGRYSTESPREYAVELLAATTEATLHLPVLEQRLVGHLGDRLGDDVQFRLAFSSELIDGLRNCYSGLFERFVESESASLWRTSAGVDHGLLVRETGDPPVALLLFGQRGHLDGLIGLRGPDSRHWGMEVVRDYCSTGEEATIATN